MRTPIPKHIEHYAKLNLMALPSTQESLAEAESQLNFSMEDKSPSQLNVIVD